ncbi:hypothetical protein ACOSQ4_004797 [Xanthoceras sorbifolium]
MLKVALESSTVNLSFMVLYWATIFLFRAGAASKLEWEALLNSTWRNSIAASGYNKSNHCEWDRITCDSAGSITGIYLHGMGLKGELDQLNFSCFPNLQVLHVWNNSLSGIIPSHTVFLSKLKTLDLAANNFTGVIPTEIGNLRSLTDLFLASNKLTGPLPSTLGLLSNINGTIPGELTRLNQLIYLDLSSNHLSGKVPITVGELYNLEYLDISNNLLSGPIPTDFWNCSKLESLTLSKNSLSGKILLELAKTPFLKLLDLGYNLLNGTIPFQLGKMSFLRYLYLSHNKLSGIIPESLSNMRDLNLSYNNLEGEIPIALLQCTFPLEQITIGNKGLYKVRGWHSCFTHPTSTTNHEQVTISFVKNFFSVTVCLAIAISAFICFFKHKFKTPTLDGRETKPRDLFSIWNYYGRIAFEEIIEATDDFDIKYCIGTGAYGSVYRAQLSDGKIIALKKLHRWKSEDPIFTKSFQNEVLVLSEIRHQNIVKLYGFCLHKNCMFLVYEYIERGTTDLDWSKRVNIIKGVSHALTYLHHNCSPSTVHRDISSNNILLNSKFEAFVADFGTVRLLHSDSSNRTVVAGTYGYIAPEFLSSLTSQLGQNVMLINLLDSRLSPPVDQRAVKDVVLVSTIAFACLHAKPKSRPSMERVSQELLAHKIPMSKALHEITIAQLRDHGMRLFDECDS